MAFPYTTFPGSLDGSLTRMDGVDIVYDDDFMYHDRQIVQLQTYLGISGALIGAGVATHGPGGMVSPVASGGTALQLAARAAFSAGTLLSVGDAYDTVFTEKFRVNYGGLVWSYGGFDASQLLLIPHGATVVAGVEGRLRWNEDTLGLEYDDGAAWNPVGGGAAGGYLDWVCSFSYTEAPAPVEETMGCGTFDGSAAGGMEVYFRATVDPSLSAGSATITLYDLGDKGSPPGVPRTVCTLVATTNGRQDLEIASPGLTIVDPPTVPSTGEILSTPRMYEITITSAAVVGDTVLAYSCGLDVR